MDRHVWQVIASNWRNINQSIEKISIVEEVTKKAISQIKQRNLLESRRGYLDDDDDDDFI